MNNKALVGSVNSNVSHFEAAVETLGEFPAWFVDDLVTGVHDLGNYEAAFAQDETTIKTAVQFSQI